MIKEIKEVEVIQQFQAGTFHILVLRCIEKKIWLGKPNVWLDRRK